MRRAGSSVTAVAACTTACLLAGCGTSPRDQVKAKVEQFGNAVAHRDYKTICSQVLAPSLLTHLAATGISCEQAMRLGLRRVQNPTLSIGKITVSGRQASAVTLSGASGQRAALRTIQLVRTSGGWRISSLTSP